MPSGARPPSRLWPIMCIVLGLTVLAMPFDAHITALLASPFSQRVLRPCLTFFDFMGGYSVHFLCFGIVMAYIPTARTAIRYMVLMWGSTILYTVIKIAVGRSRPGAHLGPFAFHPFALLAKGADSFPSGQACSAMALATILGLYFPKGRWWFWAIAAVTSLGRVVELRHFMSDVVFGAGLGLVFVLAVGRLLPEASERKSEPAPRS